MDKIRSEDRAARLLQRYLVLYRLRRQALDKIGELRRIREEERLKYITDLREKAALYIQRIFRGCRDRSIVIGMAVEQQIEAAQGRVGEADVDEDKLQPTLVESRKARYQLKAKRKRVKSLR